MNKAYRPISHLLDILVQPKILICKLDRKYPTKSTELVIFVCNMLKFMFKKLRTFLNPHVHTDTAVISDNNPSGATTSAVLNYTCTRMLILSVNQRIM